VHPSTRCRLLTALLCVTDQPDCPSPSSSFRSRSMLGAKRSRSRSARLPFRLQLHLEGSDEEVYRATLSARLTRCPPVRTEPRPTSLSALCLERSFSPIVVLRMARRRQAPFSRSSLQSSLINPATGGRSNSLWRIVLEIGRSGCHSSGAL
jgi:hypothetical protein